MINLQIPGMPTAMPDSVPDRGQELAMLKSLPFDELMDRIVHSMVEFAINLAIAIVVFYVGRLIITKLYKVVSGVFARRSIDRSLAVFVLSMVRIVLYFILIVTVIGILGINTTSFIAIFASAGVAVGMALSGTLQNFAGGVLILLLKPYKIGDYIEAQGYAGTVREIQIFHTIINTPDNKVIIIPNGGLSTGSLNNWSREDYRRVDWIVSISYGDNIAEAREKILAILASDGRVVERYLEDDRERHAAAIAEQAAATGRREGSARHSPHIPPPPQSRQRSTARGCQAGGKPLCRKPCRPRARRVGVGARSKQCRPQSKRMDPLRELLGCVLQRQRAHTRRTTIRKHPFPLPAARRAPVARRMSND